MKRKALIFFLIFWSYIAFCQNFQTIKNNGIYLFSNNYESVKAIRIDSLASNSQDSVFYNFQAIRQNDSIYDCFIPTGASWIGKFVIIKPNGINLFFNHANDTIKINSRALIHDSWTCFSFANGDFVEAFVSSFDTASFLGLVDSVKTISFQLKDSSGASLQHTINNYNIKLSKFHGLIDIVEFYSFPDVTSTFHIIGGPNLQGKENLTYQKVFDYNIGDEFHKEYFDGYYSGNYYSTTKTSIFKIIDKFNVSQDSVTYTYTRCERDVDGYGANAQFTYYHDTVTSTIKYSNFNFDNAFFNHLPDETIYSNINTGISYLIMDLTFNGRVQKTMPISQFLYGFNSGNDCWYETIFDGCWENDIYVEGCGGPYYYCEFGVDKYYNNLLYYKKGNEEWGTPLNCADLLIGIENNITQTKKQAQIFPNPINENSILKIYDFTHNPFVLQIYDGLGKKIYEKNITRKESILDLRGISKGVYYYILYDNIGYTTKDKIIIE